MKKSNISIISKILALFIAMTFFSQVNAQKCNIALSGSIIDKGSDIPLEFANIFMEENGKGAVSDANGLFSIADICPGNYHLKISHIGCASKNIFINIQNDTMLSIELPHHIELLNEVVIHESRKSGGGQVSQSINQNEISRLGNKSLSEILDNISGVNSIKGGSGIAKPVIHGMYGNRITILNNGVAQSGQQWGNDHAPEIDPFIANHIAVIKGANTLAYGSNAIGGLILVDPGNIGNDPHLHGHFNYIFNSNGLGHTANIKLEKYNDKISWRWVGTFKRNGDLHAPDYFLTNTGKREINSALQLEKKIKPNWHSRLYYSLFSTKIGILRGSHIGNLTDLDAALSRPIPFFTEDNFSYAINAPKQEVFHHFLKFENKYFITDEQILSLTYGGQWNNRKEYDIRRGGRTDTPALSLNQFTHFFEAKYSQSFDNKLFLNSGLQFKLIDNANRPGTGILPLIPNYLSYTPSVFLIAKKEYEQLSWEIGARYDYKYLDVTTISTSYPREIEYYSHQFHNYSFSGGINAKINSDWQATLNTGFMQRAPGINELYSYGLHQGVSGIEEGNRHLNQEKSLKTILSIEGKIKNKLFFQGLTYLQTIKDYIYLEPQSEYRLTIRGAFPLFLYKQTDAKLFGTDLQLQYEMNDYLKLTTQYSMIRGNDVSKDIPLIYMPADNISAKLKYNFKAGERLDQGFIRLSGKYVWKQSRLLEDQDFSPAPDAYFLANFEMGSHVKIGQSGFFIELDIDNLFNTSYRDYLNRLRYFADETGRDIQLKLKYQFE